MKQDKLALHKHFSLSAHFSLDMKHTISSNWPTNPNCAYNHFLHNFWSSCEYLIHGQSEDSFSLLNFEYIGPLNYIDDCWAHNGSQILNT